MSRTERKRLEAAEELRREIAAAAFAEFATRGYHQTTVADITARVGVSAGTFYNYFASKREILDHVIDGLSERVIAALTATDTPDAPTTLEEYRAQALRIAEVMDGILITEEHAARLLLFQATAIDPELTEKVLGLFDMFRAIATAYLENGVRRGFFRADVDVPYTADAATGLMLAAMLRTVRSELGPEERAELRRAVVATFLDGVRVVDSAFRARGSSAQ